MTTSCLDRSATLWKTDATIRSLSSSGTCWKPKCVVGPGEVYEDEELNGDNDAAVERVPRKRLARGERRRTSDSDIGDD